MSRQINIKQLIRLYRGFPVMPIDPVTAACNTITALATLLTELIKTPEGRAQVALVTDTWTTIHNFLHHKTQDAK